MMHDVKIKKLKLLPDERGFLMEMLRCDDEVFKDFGQVYITGCARGIAKAWHYHKEQTDNFVCVYGRALVVLCDLRDGSPTYGVSQEFILDAPPLKGEGNMLLQIPALVVHGFTAYECDDARIINIPTLPYKYEKPDEYRYPWNSEEIPYKWPPYVTRGG
ncbi:MAG TPA: dTDP-4-dehydrorhamnose 3,5-epimerase [Nitrospiraceae bacterium]|nr:MAG: hypothetical protein A2035_01880 [Nitrospirae bacterium GWA2_42_11]OGW57874.1 MAG: hypothetical protein A3D21_04920 [Nitrospirae bacterium RIFCSPHIGHO2_02_FULL_42_12]HAS18249.1 dTDP-4-dehydrorhamnose 3,5-epimerase [Nitrospiraceae bacterium]HBI23888.1 dTDP-4-dehydrorhamnose 3,5-epimerase [Nitrospiraceae bacterium]